MVTYLKREENVKEKFLGVKTIVKILFCFVCFGYQKLGVNIFCCVFLSDYCTKNGCCCSACGSLS